MHFRTTLFIIGYLASNLVSSQSVSEESLNRIKLISYFGRGIHGSGDITGFNFGLNLEKELSERWFLNIGFDGSLNDDEDIPFIYEDLNGNLINGTEHQVIAGIQLSTGLGFKFINTDNHDFGMLPSLLFRYQASSLNDVETTLFPPITGLPIPIRIIENDGDNRTYSVGGNLRLHYDFIYRSKYSLGLQGAWQTDTNGDALAHYALRFGYILN